MDERKQAVPEMEKQRAAQVGKLIEDAAERFMRKPGKAPPPTTPEQRAAGFERLAVGYDPPVRCRSCGQDVARGINSVCGPCFVGGYDARPPGEPAPPPDPVVEPPIAEPPATLGVCCAICQRDAERLRDGEGLCRGPKGTAVCTTCAQAALEASGVRKGDAPNKGQDFEIRVRREAASMCADMMRHAVDAAQQGKPERAKLLAEAAESLGAIARGGDR